MSNPWPMDLAEHPDVRVLREHVATALRDIRLQHGRVCATVVRSRIVDVLTVLRDNPDTLYRFFSECVCVDYLNPSTRALILGRTERFEVTYNLVSIYDPKTQTGTGRRILVKVTVPEEDPVVPSVTSVYPGAEFPEREIFDMFGIRFEGHPDLRRLLMSDDWIGHPQRKDYPLGGERVQFPGGTYGPAVGEKAVQHPGEGFFGKTASEVE